MLGVLRRLRPIRAIGRHRTYPMPTVWLRTAAGNVRGWFPRSLVSDRRRRHPAIPLRPRHGYAVDLHRGLRTQASKTQPEVPHTHHYASGVRAAIQPISTGFELAENQEA
jgi:hypothetical protein